MTGVKNWHFLSHGSVKITYFNKKKFHWMVSIFPAEAVQSDSRGNFLFCGDHPLQGMWLVDHKISFGGTLPLVCCIFLYS